MQIQKVIISAPQLFDIEPSTAIFNRALNFKELVRPNGVATDKQEFSVAGKGKAGDRILVGNGGNGVQDGEG